MILWIDTTGRIRDVLTENCIWMVYTESGIRFNPALFFDEKLSGVFYVGY